MTSAAEDGYRRVRPVSDRPISSDDEDFLGYASYAAALVELISDARTETPLTISVQGPWGSGKTSLMRLVERKLEKKTIVVWFNASLHEDAPKPGVALASAVVKKINPYRRWWRRLIDPVATSLVSPASGWRRQILIGVFSGILAGAVVALPSSRELLQAMAGNAAKPIGTGGIATGALLTALFWFAVSRIFNTASAFSRFVASPREEAARGGMDAVRTELARLVSQALRGKRRLLIVVDDVDRGSGGRAMELCDAVGKLLDHEGVVAVLVGTPHAPDLTAVQQDRKYLQRLVQLQLRLPEGEPDAIRAMVRRTLTKKPSSHLTKSQLLAKVRAFGRRANLFSAGVQRPALVDYAIASGYAVAVLLVAFLIRTFFLG
ncbi:AAA family ATPase [Lentzea tibetensis]|uniref:AAA family ATPase n=1 Tax=Lentzea tibetensis TaxID=2591470 RepID=A0A563EFY9_9PSEU|nr:P-loop NTPase fold protein [Lentzea tibetensis]TWP43242.1 AAA family ATPase [Lentzea tibetensis]